MQRAPAVMSRWKFPSSNLNGVAQGSSFGIRRFVILLLGGDKTGDDRWYETDVPVADRLFEQHLRQFDVGIGVPPPLHAEPKH